MINAQTNSFSNRFPLWMQNLSAIKETLDRKKAGHEDEVCGKAVTAKESWRERE